MEPPLPVPESRAPPDLIDHVLEEIFVRIDVPADLARASAACKAFRRLITDPTFLRRYRSLHPPLLLGFIGPASDISFFPADGSHPNAPAGRAFAGAADFSYGHLPYRRDDWRCCDAREGRVLLIYSEPGRGLVLPELAICDPLTRGYTLLPPIPDGLLASVLVQVQEENVHYFDAFFDPSGGYEEAQFGVMCWTRSPTTGAIFIYSSISGSWTRGASVSWNALGVDNLLDGILRPNQWPGYANGCLYWKDVTMNQLIKFNINSMGFSSVRLPYDYDFRSILVVEAGEGRIGMFSLLHNSQYLHYSIWQNGIVNAHQHPLETTISLPYEYDHYFFGGVAKGYIFLIGFRGDRSLSSAFFSLEVETMKVEKFCLSNSKCHHLIPYFGFPPIMSPRRM